jgi:4-hydroxy-tetrahydrodipicolinate reductase
MTQNLKIILMGYGRMGKEIEAISIQRGHDIVLKIDARNAADISDTDLKKGDVIIEFSQPGSAVANINRCLKAGVPVIVGTTGWYAELAAVESACRQMNGSVLYASNFSVGVNILFELNHKLAALMARRTEYDVSIDEVHHIHKIDKPSGTGITLAEGVLNHINRKKKWVLDEVKSADELAIHSIRENEIVGKHTVKYISDIDEIEIMHNAFSRKGFATGALLAAEFIIGRKGFFTMKDVLNS